MDISLSFARGMLAAVNPCGFVLLPTYLLYFLGISNTNGVVQRGSLGRAFAVGGAVSSGFLVVFVVIGAVAEYFTDWVVGNSKYVTLVDWRGLRDPGCGDALRLSGPLRSPEARCGWS